LAIDELRDTKPDQLVIIDDGDPNKITPRSECR
jgi:hypothetical protein